MTKEKTLTAEEVLRYAGIVVANSSGESERIPTGYKSTTEPVFLEDLRSDVRLIVFFNKNYVSRFATLEGQRRVSGGYECVLLSEIKNTSSKSSLKSFYDMLARMRAPEPENLT